MQLGEILHDLNSYLTPFPLDFLCVCMCVYTCGERERELGVRAHENRSTQTRCPSYTILKMCGL